MSPLIEEIVNRLHQLPESKVEEVLDFVNSLAPASTNNLENSKQQFEQLQQRWQGQLLSDSVELLQEDRSR